jgi:hypothetical protein
MTIMVSDEDDVTENGQGVPAAGAAIERTEYVQSLERGISVITALPKWPSPRGSRGAPRVGSC